MFLPLMRPLRKSLRLCVQLHQINGSPQRSQPQHPRYP